MSLGLNKNELLELATKDIDGVNLIDYVQNKHKDWHPTKVVNFLAELFKDKEKLLSYKKQARINADLHSSKYYGESVADVYKHAIETKNSDNYGILGKLVDRLKSKEDK